MSAVIYKVVATRELTVFIYNLVTWYMICAEPGDWAYDNRFMQVIPSKNSLLQLSLIVYPSRPQFWPKTCFSLQFHYLWNMLGMRIREMINKMTIHTMIPNGALITKQVEINSQQEHFKCYTHFRQTHGNPISRYAINDCFKLHI